MAELWIWLAAGTVITCVGAADLAEQRNSSPMLRRILLGVRCVIYGCAVLFFSVEGLVVSMMHSECPAGVEYLLVPGAMVNQEEPGPVLRLRVESAEQYLHQNPQTTVVLCGGQGKGEAISEAECMRRMMIEAGISEERIWLEDRSTSTLENMRFAWELIADADASVGVITSNFHLWRTVRLAEKCGWNSVGGGAASCSGILLPHYMAREFLTISVYWLRGSL